MPEFIVNRLQRCDTDGYLWRNGSPWAGMSDENERAAREVKIPTVNSSRRHQCLARTRDALDGDLRTAVKPRQDSPVRAAVLAIRIACDTPMPQAFHLIPSTITYPDAAALVTACRFLGLRLIGEILRDPASSEGEHVRDRRRIRLW
ncbi:hypothetical protein [Burkholderia arboris]|uniref:hypothetical protein n=1 Tax=Burkholderia arboris TaxID=488730 RepID=UPI0030F200BB